MASRSLPTTPQAPSAPAELPWVHFNRRFSAPNESALITEALAHGALSGDGRFTSKCEELLEEVIGAKRALLTTSCTDALEMSALLLDLKPGDEVIVPSFTFVSTANAFALRGARPIFCDVDPRTLNLDPSHAARLITNHTRAMVPVHYAGVGCEMSCLMELAVAHGLEIVEDNAHGLFGTWQGRNLGTLGGLATLSFHDTKNMGCGEGGALLINDPKYLEQAEIIREKGTNRKRFFRGEVDRYTWIGLGSSHVPSELLAALLLSQLQAREVIQQRRHDVWNAYHAALGNWAMQQAIELPTIPPGVSHPAHIYYLLLPNLPLRTSLIDHLKACRIVSVFHYQPLHLSEMGSSFGAKLGDCPVAEKIADRLLRLPLHANLTPEDVERVIDALLSWSPA